MLMPSAACQWSLLASGGGDLAPARSLRLTTTSIVPRMTITAVLKRNQVAPLLVRRRVRSDEARAYRLREEALPMDREVPRPAPGSDGAGRRGGPWSNPRESPGRPPPVRGQAAERRPNGVRRTATVNGGARRASGTGGFGSPRPARGSRTQPARRPPAIRAGATASTDRRPRRT